MSHSEARGTTVARRGNLLKNINKIICRQIKIAKTPKTQAIQWVKPICRVLRYVWKMAEACHAERTQDGQLFEDLYGSAP